MATMSSSGRASVGSSSTHSSKPSSSSSKSFTPDCIAPEQRPRFIQPGLPTLTWPEERGSASIIYATRIYAPIALVASALLDTRSYSSWNRYCPTIQVNSQPRSTAPIPPIVARDPSVAAIANLPSTLRDGATFTPHVLLDVASVPENASAVMQNSKYPTYNTKACPELQVSALDQYIRPDGRICMRMAWRARGKMANFLLRNERVHELVTSPDDPNMTDYVCWETFFGGLNGAMQSVYGKQMERGYGMFMDGLKRNSEERARGRAMAEEVIEQKRSHAEDGLVPAPIVSI
ncbi:hypothetical protein V2G26_017000 [Clonostachys chloroleuca]|uniref:Coenzyme Q-binding protein COQ10 START domain-containing protein n=1 Tax=Clonostachys chloroleuca TaxID=1926264 RepID=A0AA35MB22_9HYPO|nr:unnamed protein product [Clonostachys chloroleuca]